MTPKFNVKKYINKNMEVADTFSFEGTVVSAFCAQNPDRGHNEDCAFAMALSPDVLVFAVADGAGGHRFGEKASAIAIEELETQLKGTDGSLAAVRLAILDSFESANTKILEMKVGAATTLTVVEVAYGYVRTYHAGDSFAMLQSERGRLKHRTIGHCATELAVESGVVDHSEEVDESLRHVITNYLGSLDLRVEVSAKHLLAKKDTLIVGSDGLTDNLSDEDLSQFSLEKQASVTMEKICKATIMTMNDEYIQTAKKDDLSIFVVKFDES